MVELDNNAYSVPWRLIGKTVRATLMARGVRASAAGRVTA
jgi:hypothetical protein